MFDEIPENLSESYPCDCGGDIEYDSDRDIWQCSTCEVTM